MSELQAAVGLAQLSKLNMIIEAQRTNKELLWDAIADLPGIEPRSIPENSYETADALVFLVPTNAIARNCRDELLKVGLSTKILPEAYTWHFAGSWSHMPELVTSHGGNLADKFNASHAILSRAVSSNWREAFRRLTLSRSPSTAN